jgi:2-hydroxy-3-oxopropionate reductase
MPAELARHCEVVISVVTASADVEHLALGSDGLIDGLAEGAIHVDMSTIAPETARKVAARYAKRVSAGWMRRCRAARWGA